MIYNAAFIEAILKSSLSSNKKIALIGIAASFLNESTNGRRRPHNRRNPRNGFRNRGYAIEEMAYLDDATFKRMFRLDRDTFAYLVQQLKPLIQRNDTYAINRSGQPIAVTTRVAVTLRWLAGASALDLCFAWGIARATFYSDRGVLWPTIEAIDYLFKIGLPLNDNEKLEELARGFHEHSR